MINMEIEKLELFADEIDSLIKKYDQLFSDLSRAFDRIDELEQQMKKVAEFALMLQSELNKLRREIYTKK